MQKSKILTLLLSLGFALVPQISLAQTAEELEQRASAAEEVKNYEEAAKIWQSAIKGDRNNSYAYIKLADILSNQGKIEDTIAAYRQALQITPESTVYIKLADFLAEKGRISEAITAYRQAIQLDSTNDTAYITLASHLLEMGKVEEALTAYRQAVKLKPEADNYNSLGDALLKTGNREEAITAYRQALKLDPTSYHALNSLSELLEYSEVAAIYRQITTTNSKNETAYEALAELSTKRGFIDNAMPAASRFASTLLIGNLYKSSLKLQTMLP
ncbi:tetratricopeptide repeat protein [Tolypothrix sp. VBCCA 56010]|uniref:tetratricopeptide repeat protein n=1 Tax=Tolypothrix sp. VBCCA 56010 TaxID=3137731 RepID=UPI003D7E313B